MYTDICTHTHRYILIYIQFCIFRKCSVIMSVVVLQVLCNVIQRSMDTMLLTILPRENLNELINTFLVQWLGKFSPELGYSNHSVRY